MVTWKYHILGMEDETRIIMRLSKCSQSNCIPHYLTTFFVTQCYPEKVTFNCNTIGYSNNTKVTTHILAISSTCVNK